MILSLIDIQHHYRSLHKRCCAYDAGKADRALWILECFNLFSKTHVFLLKKTNWFFLQDKYLIALKGVGLVKEMISSGRCTCTFFWTLINEHFSLKEIKCQFKWSSLHQLLNPVSCQKTVLSMHVNELNRSVWSKTKITENCSL